MNWLMNKWDPNVQMIDVLEDVIWLLDYPDKVEMYDAFNYEAASQWTTDKAGYLANAREYTLKYESKKKDEKAKSPKELKVIKKKMLMAY